MTERTTKTLTTALFAALLLWGGFTFLAYLGVPLHQLVYMTPNEAGAFDATCGADTSVSTLLCRGTATFWSFIGAFFSMGSPFLPYAIVCALIAGAFLCRAGFSTGVFACRFRVRPIVLVGLFVASVWLLGTTFSLSTVYNLRTPEGAKVLDTVGDHILPPFSRFYEPTEGVYPGTGAQALAELRANYEQLLNAGCLTPLTNAAGQELTLQSGGKVYDLSFFCMQGSFFTRAGIQILMMLVFLLNLLVVGRAVIEKVIRLKPVHPLLHLILSCAVGALSWVALLWALALFGILTPTVTRVLFFAAPVVLFPWTRAWWRDSFASVAEFDLSLQNPQALLVWLLLTYLALNFLNVVRPFPIGWDDLGSYLNRPRLLSSTGSFLPSMSQFQWEYLTSLGFLIFGYDSPAGATFAMQINWAAGLLAVLVTYAFGRIFLGRGAGILAAMLYYLLPMTGHFSFADMKIDNAAYFTGATAILTVLYAFFRDREDDSGVPDRRLILLGGLLLGFSFGIKPTAILSGLLIASMIAGATMGPLGFTAAAFASMGLLTGFGVISIPQVSSRLVMALPSGTAIMAGFLVLALIPLVLAARRSLPQLKAAALSLGFFGAGALVAMLPWGIHNIATHGYTFNVASFLSPADTTAPQVFVESADVVKTYNLPPTVPVRTLPSDLKLNTDDPACHTSAKAEELDRYWGFGTGVMHYLTLPWREIMNIDSFGYYVTLAPALFLFPLLLLLPFFWSAEGRWLRLLFAGTTMYLVQWIFAANGISWYGIVMFFGFAICLETLLARAPDKANRILAAVLITGSILVCLVNRFWQFDTQKNIFEYPMGKTSAAALREVTIPNYDDIRESVVARHESMSGRPYTYRIGTFISYFVPKNRDIFPLADHQMGFFNCLNQEQNHALTLKRLQALGFNSIIFDTNTQTIEKDPNGSLHQKVQKFVDFINDPALKLELPVYDPGSGIAYILLP